MTARYPYQPLPENSIRVLILRAGKLGSPIHATLRQTHLLDTDKKSTCTISYEALSYEWGPATSPTETIFINEIPVDVRRNLFLALKRIRLRNEERTLWVDALCINQDNVVERSAQVRVMGQVYSQARGVVAWLGPAYENSYAGFQYVRRAVDEMKKTGALVDFPKRMGETRSKAFSKLLHRTYWTRLWIIQEFVLAKRIIIACGPDQVSWEDFKSAQDFNSPCSIVGSMRDVTQDCRTIEYLIDKSRLAQAQDPRDRIYGLLGMVAPSRTASDRHSIYFPPVNYEKDSFEVFGDTVRYYYSSSEDPDRKLRLIRLAQKIQIALKINTDMEPFPRKRNHPILREPFYFAVEGIIRSTIRKIGPTFTSRPTVADVEEWQAWRKANNMENFWDTLQHILNPATFEGNKRFETCAKAVNEVFNEEYQGSYAISIGAHDSKSKDQEPVLETKQLTGEVDLVNRLPRLAKCSSNLAIVPWNASEGDVVCQFADTRISAVISRDPLILKGTAYFVPRFDYESKTSIKGIIQDNTHPGELISGLSYTFKKVVFKVDIRVLQFLTTFDIYRSSH